MRWLQLDKSLIINPAHIVSMLVREAGARFTVYLMLPSTEFQVFEGSLDDCREFMFRLADVLGDVVLLDDVQLGSRTGERGDE